MIKRYLLLLFFFLLTNGFNLYAQSDDFALRSGLEIKKDFRKGFNLSLEYQYRRNQYLSMFQASYFSISPSYKINNVLSTSFEFRYGTSKVWDRFRYAYYLSAKKNIGKVQLSLRGGYLYEHYLQEVVEINQFTATNSLRFRLQAERKLVKHVKATISSEPIIRINNGMEMRQMRNIVELSWEFLKNQEFSLSYLQMPTFNNSLYLNSNHILQVNYRILIPKTKK